MKIPREILKCAIDEIVVRGDTDIFPHPFELHFFADRAEGIAEELSQIDVTQYRPLSLVESLIPKSKFGFRVGHQPYPVDTLIYTALVLMIADEIESMRDPADKRRAFSYRKSPGLTADFFSDGHTFSDWLLGLKGKLFSEDYSHVIRTDISDYYTRIYRHRLENILLALTKKQTVAKKIESFISDWRGTQSFGIPVGSNASRLLAEIALHDIDMALVAEGIEHTRFVDDFRIFVRKGKDPYAALSFLAKLLWSNEGLALNSQKTKIMTWREFFQSAGDDESEDDVSKEEFATEKLFRAAYGQDEVDEEALAALTLKDLGKELEDELEGTHWDMEKIRIVLHAMRLGCILING